MGNHWKIILFFYRAAPYAWTQDFLFVEDKSSKGGLLSVQAAFDGVPVFVNCRLTSGAPTATVNKGKSWRPFAKTVFITCEMGEHINPKVWHNWNKPEDEKTVFYAQYHSKGTGADPGTRVSWSEQLNEKDFNNYSLRKIFNDRIPNEESAL